MHVYGLSARDVADGWSGSESQQTVDFFGVKPEQYVHQSTTRVDDCILTQNKTKSNKTWVVFTASLRVSKNGTSMEMFTF